MNHPHVRFHVHSVVLGEIDVDRHEGPGHFDGAGFVERQTGPNSVRLLALTISSHHIIPETAASVNSGEAHVSPQLILFAMLS